MKRLILKLVIILTAFFLFAGFAYSSWTDEVEVNVNAGTGITHLKIATYTIVSGNHNKSRISINDNNVKIEADNLDADSIKIKFTIKNTGTIPVDIDSIKLYEKLMLSGKKNDAKNVSMDIELYIMGNKVLDKETKLSDISGKNKSVYIRTRRNARLHTGQEALVYVTLTYDDKGNNKDNNGKGINKEKDKDKLSKSISFEFNLGIMYSRFNK